MKLIDHGSKWGDVFRHRFYIDGKRVPQWKLESVFNAYSKHYDYERKYESDTTWFRVTYMFQGVTYND